MTEILFDTIKLNPQLTLSNRIVMAPLTRCMADDDLVPTQLMADYYARRADSGLIISEATIIRPDGQGYPNTPGIYTKDQITGWRRVTDAVHAKGGKIFLQLWHTGRVAHPHFFKDGEVLAPSAERLDGSIPRMRDLSYVTPKPASKSEIEKLVEDFANAAENAIEAGFDGVEIHGANGYLIDQFLHYDTNKRNDEYGETPENMARFPLAIVDAISQRIGSERTALRISPGAYFNITPDARDRQVFEYFLAALEQRELAYLHLGLFDDNMTFDFLDGSATDFVRRHYSKLLMGVGGYNAETGSQAIKNNRFDLLAIGRPFIANPDYVEKVKTGGLVREYDESMLEQLI
ncbi:alkene reductase [Thalassotalea insulae]|uniref:Alkene reductase n=1 Tax=Thalassotalea insulae TaxID=2056778 RepID=A0ABQ6GTF9_9GAMM|nr:alkene reductase [Thalassotalea insulae]GLX79230.1 alkene reductase [Thalassotalea insulae]